MNIIGKVTFETLKKNRVRTLVTIIGIILSAAMFTAVATIVSSIYSYYVKAEKYVVGNYHVKVARCDSELITSMMDDKRVSVNAFAEYLGYADINSSNSDKPYLCLFGVNDAFFENMPVHLTEGRLPENDGEIVLPEHLYTNGDVKTYLNEKLDLSVGKRISNIGETLYQNTAFTDEAETLCDEHELSFTVVGFYKRPDFEDYSSPGYSALFRKNELSNDGVYEYFFKLNKASKELDAVLRDHGIDKLNHHLHTAMLMADGAVKNDSVFKALIILASVLCVLIFAGSVSLIYSAFSISVSERTKQFGILSSVGATKKQLGKGVLHEALLLSSVAIPIGIVFGILGIGATLYLLRGSFSMLSNSSGYKGTITLSVNMYAIIIAALLSFVTVIVSALIPSIRAKRVSPIEAIRQTRDIKTNGKSRRASKLFMRLFGAEGLLAKKYYDRSKKKYRATVLSLAMSIILFVSASSFTFFLTRTAKIEETVFGSSNFDLSYTGLTPEEYEVVKPLLKGFTNEHAAYLVAADTAYYLVDDNGITDEYREHLKSDEDEDNLFFAPNASIVYLEDAAFEKLIKDNALDPSAFKSGEKAAIAINSGRHIEFDNNQIKRVSSFEFFNKKLDSIEITEPIDTKKAENELGVHWSGDSFGSGDAFIYGYDESLPDSEAEIITFDEHGRPVNGVKRKLEFHRMKIGALIANAPVGIPKSSMYTVSFILPMSAFGGNCDSVKLYMNCDDAKTAANELKQALNERGIEFVPSKLTDATESNRMMKSFVTIINVFTYGFIALITLISAANVFNTITTNVALRKRDYAMLRSMGMTKRGMDRMMDYECLLYGSRALLFGLPIAILISFIIYKGTSNIVDAGFTLPYLAIAIAIISIFIVVFASMLYQTGRIKNDNLIDTLKNDNI